MMDGSLQFGVVHFYFYFHKVKKWQDRGYWISKQYYWQSMVYYLYNAAKYRSLTYFSACNPALSFGGMLADDKTEAYKIIPDRYLPQTIIYNSDQNIKEQLAHRSIQFPVVVKPNMGYKGYAVQECTDLENLEKYINELDHKKEWLIQEYVDHKCEYSIMYYRSPISDEYGITSISDKKYPSVIGDASRSLNQLIDDYENAFIDKEYLKKKWEDDLAKTPSYKEEIQLHHIGNYSRGSKFNSSMNEKDDRLALAMHNVFSGSDEIYFCRFDIKADSMEAVRNGDFKIMEINGAKSEPLHIYDPQYGLFDRMKEVRKHWKLMTRIIDERRKQGYQFPGNIAGLKSVQAVKSGVR